MLVYYKLLEAESERVFRKYGVWVDPMSIGVAGKVQNIERIAIAQGKYLPTQIPEEGPVEGVPSYREQRQQLPPSPSPSPIEVMYSPTGLPMGVVPPKAETLFPVIRLPTGFPIGIVPPSPPELEEALFLVEPTKLGIIYSPTGLPMGAVPLFIDSEALGLPSEAKIEQTFPKETLLTGSEIREYLRLVPPEMRKGFFEGRLSPEKYGLPSEAKIVKVTQDEMGQLTVEYILPTPTWKETTKTGAILSGEIGRFPSCLLYTSDAADE